MRYPLFPETPSPIRSWRGPFVWVVFWGGFLGVHTVWASSLKPEVFERAVRSVLAVEFFIQHELERQAMETVGVVVDDEGLLVVPESAISSWLPPEQFREFKAFVPGAGGSGLPARYLGQNLVNGWHYLRIEEELPRDLLPVTLYKVARPQLGEELWGIGLQSRELEFKPYFLSTRLSLSQKLPLETGFTTGAVAIPGGLVFNFAGDLVGWALDSYPEERVLLSGGRRMVVALANYRESNAFRLAQEWVPALGNVPADPVVEKRPWIGVSGMQAIERETAEFLGLADQGAVVISEVLADSPAQAGGLLNGDIVLAVNGEKLPRLLPAAVVPDYLQRLLLQSSIGETLRLKVARGEDHLDLAIVIGSAPKQLKAAEREFFAELGLTVREFVLTDAIQRRVHPAQAQGVIASFVKQNSPVNSAGLQHGDWIQSIDGEAVENFHDGRSRLAEIAEDIQREEFVLLISRDNETSLLRVKLR